MGWKNVKDHYRIIHVVEQTERGICIGSGAIRDLLAISRDGVVTKRYNGPNEDLARYQQEMDADPELLARLVTTPDTFHKSVPVYTYSGADIIEQFCEEPGWPNSTHDGQVMCQNTHYTDKAQAVRRAKDNARAAVICMQDRLEALKQEVADCEVGLAAYRENAARLDRDYPE